MPPADDLDPPLAPRPLSAAEQRARTLGRAADALVEPILRPRISAHLAACRLALDAIELELDWLTETYDVDPTASTRAAALWLLIGRCVGQQRAVLLLAEHGMVVEGRPLDRAVKEMSNVAKAIAVDGPAAEKLARQWLADGNYVKAQAGRQAMTLPFKDQPGEQAAFSGVGVSSLDAADKHVYDDLSRASHGRRSSLVESFYSETRHMARGANYALLDQAKAVEWASSTTGGVVLAAAAMLIPFRGRQYVVDSILSLHIAIDAIRNDQPLDAEKVAAEAGVSRYPFWPLG